MRLRYAEMAHAPTQLRAWTGKDRAKIEALLPSCAQA